MPNDQQFHMEADSDETNRDPDMMKKVMQTILVTSTLFIFGIMRCQEGVIFLDLVFITGSDVTSGSSMFTATALGLVIGILLVCPLFDKFNNDIVFCACLVGSGVITLVMPLCKSLLVITIMFGARSFFIGPATSGGSVLLTRAWLQKAGPFIQNMLLFFSFGGLIAPFIAEPFLMEGLADNVNISFISMNGSTWNMTERNFSVSVDESNESRVYVTFLITGGLLVIVAVGFVLKICLFSSKEFYWTHKNGKSTISDSTRLDRLASFSLKAKIVCYTLLGVHTVSYGCVAQVSVAFLMTFVVEYLGMSKKSGSLINTVFWTGQVLGRLLGIFLIELLKPRTLLTVDIMGLVFMFGTMLLANGLSWSPVVWWVLIGCSGVFFGSVNATTISWLDTTLTPVTGKLMTFVFVNAMVGMFTHMSLLGYLFDHFTAMWFVYLLLMYSVLLLLTFIGLVVAAKCFTRLYCPMKSDQAMATKSIACTLDNKSASLLSVEQDNLLEKNDANLSRPSN